MFSVPTAAIGVVLALKLTGAVQAARWRDTADGTGYIYSFNGPQSLFVDTIRSCRILMVAHRLGHRLRDDGLVMDLEQKPLGEKGLGIERFRGLVPLAERVGLRPRKLAQRHVSLRRNGIAVAHRPLDAGRARLFGAGPQRAPGTTPETEVLFAAPVTKVVPTSTPGACEVTDLVVMEALGLERFTDGVEGFRDQIVRQQGQCSRLCPRAELSPGFDRQCVGTQMRHSEARNRPNLGSGPFRLESYDGGNARLVMLPLESHGYAARESIEHTLYEQVAWFDKHVKNAKPRTQGANAAK